MFNSSSVKKATIPLVFLFSLVALPSQAEEITISKEDIIDGISMTGICSEISFDETNYGEFGKICEKLDQINIIKDRRIVLCKMNSAFLHAQNNVETTTNVFNAKNKDNESINLEKGIKSSGEIDQEEKKCIKKIKDSSQIQVQTLISKSPYANGFTVTITPK